MCVWGLATLGPASWTVKRESRRGPATRSQPGVTNVKGVWVWGLATQGDASWTVKKGVKVTSGDLEPTWS